MINRPFEVTYEIINKIGNATSSTIFYTFGLLYEDVMMVIMVTLTIVKMNGFIARIISLPE